MPAIVPFIPAIIGAVGSVVGGAMKNKSQSTQSTTPTIDPAYQPLQNQMLSMITRRLGTSPDLSGYQATGTGNINHTFDLLQQRQGNDLTARGLSTSPVAGAVDATRENARGGQIAGLENSLPLIGRDMQTQDLGLANNLLQFGRGSTTTGTATSGGGVGGAISNLAGYMGYLTGKGAFQRPGAFGGTGTPGYPGDGISGVNNPMAGWG